MSYLLTGQRKSYGHAKNECEIIHKGIYTGKYGEMEAINFQI